MPGLDSTAFAAALANGAIPLDLRAPVSFAGGHVPGSISLQFGKVDLGERAELYLPKSETYVLVMEPAALGPVAEKLMEQAGYKVAGHLAGGLKSYAGRLHTIPTITVAELQQRLPAPVLDVREDFEFDWAHIDGAVNIPHTEVAQRAGELDRSLHWHVVCNDQVRSGAAAGMLVRAGFERVTLVLGGTVAWVDAGYPVIKAG